MEVGREIRQLREAKGWSQTKLAADAGMGVSGISQIETGARNPSMTTLARIAGALGVEVADLFPKAEAPLWSYEAQERRHHPVFSFEEARGALERYCDSWEEIISINELDDRAISEFLVTGQGWLPMLDIALEAEMRARGLTDGDTEIGKVNRRYLDLFSKVIDVFKDRVDAHAGAHPMALSNVVHLQEVRDRALKKAVG
jgi:transcriptional regulator with XRE-family HTH domain